MGFVKSTTGIVGKTVFTGLGRACQSPLGVVGTVIRGAGGGKGRQNFVARFGNWLCEGGGAIYRVVGDNPNKSIERWVEGPVTQVTLPEIHIAVNPSKFSFLNSALYLQKALDNELKLWRSFEDLNGPARFLTYFGTQLTRLASKVLKEGLSLNLPGLRLELKSAPKPKELPFNPLRLEDSPVFDTSLVSPSAAPSVASGTSRSETESVYSHSNYILVPSETGSSHPNYILVPPEPVPADPNFILVPPSSAVNMFPMLSRLDESPNLGIVTIDPGNKSKYTSFEDLNLKYDFTLKERKTLRFSESLFVASKVQTDSFNLLGWGFLLALVAGVGFVGQKLFLFLKKQKATKSSQEQKNESKASTKPASTSLQDALDQLKK